MKSVQMLHAYRGAPSNEQLLPAGMLTLDDDLADYLVANGHAVMSNFDPNEYLMPVDKIVRVRKPRREKEA